MLVHQQQAYIVWSTQLGAIMNTISRKPIATRLPFLSLCTIVVKQALDWIVQCHF